MPVIGDGSLQSFLQEIQQLSGVEAFRIFLLAIRWILI